MTNAIHGPRGLVYTDLDKTEAFADTLELQFRANHSNDKDFRCTNSIHSEVRRILTSTTSEPIRHTSNKIEAKIKNFKPRKASGNDSISNKALSLSKLLSRKGIA
ncbi:hypothetical protein RN001_012018 [Aquatica leii]|uniref:Uncharacterized protein n=1 Tax=Aquatica leii TaxID=1421715 RepID=A0AAN7S7L7_9COLE|nr:hypothetical protein RN001_012018 [Aquatica leii]